MSPADLTLAAVDGAPQAFAPEKQRICGSWSHRELRPEARHLLD